MSGCPRFTDRSLEALLFLGKTSVDLDRSHRVYTTTTTFRDTVHARLITSFRAPIHLARTTTIFSTNIPSPNHRKLLLQQHTHVDT